MRAALLRVDVVREREHGLDVGAVPLHRDLDLAVLGRVAVRLALEVDDRLVQRLLRLVHVRDEVLDAALVVELGVLPAGALVGEDDAQPFREERRLTEPLDEDVLLPLDLVEDLLVGHEGDRRARLLRRPDRLQVGRRLAPRELLAPDLSVAADLDREPLREGVHDRHPDTVQPAGDLVALAAELPARVELREDYGHGRQSLLRHDVDRDARSVVSDGDGVVRMEDHLDVIRTAREGLVDRVVDDLEDEVMEPSGPCRTDVHAGSQTNRLEALQNGDVFCGVRCFSH